MLTAFLIFWPLLAAVVLFLLRPQNAKTIALGASIIELIVSLIVVIQFDKQIPDTQFVINLPWIASKGIMFSVGIDGISLLLVLLTTVLVPFIILASFGHTYEKSHTFYGLILMMQMVGGEEASLDASPLAIAGKHARPAIDVAPGYGLGQRHDFKPFSGLTRHRAGSGGEYHQPVCGLVSSSYFESVDQPGDAATVFVLVRTRDMTAKVPQHHLHDLLLRNTPLQKQGNRLGYGPPLCT